VETAYLTVKEVAALVKLSVITIRRYTAKNEIPFHKINRAVRYKKSEIEQWVEKRETAEADKTEKTGQQENDGGLFTDTNKVSENAGGKA
jgi:excisionase family DNA binding protein